MPLKSIATYHRGDAVEIVNSNIIDFFSHLHKPKSNVSNGNVYDKNIKDLNIPMQFIGNTTTSEKKVVPKRKLGKRVEKLPIKWENLLNKYCLIKELLLFFFSSYNVYDK